MNWGKGITIGLITFMGFITFLVVSLMRHKIDLVSEDYYQQELDYNQHFDAASVYANSVEKISVQLTKNELQLILPVSMREDSIDLQLKRPDNELLDMQFRLSAQSSINIPLKKLKKGLYDVTLKGKLQQKDYLFQESVQIP